MPSEKRSRQRAGREARMAELRRAQQRRRNMIRGGVLGGALLIAVILAVVTTTGGSSSKKTVTAPAPTAGQLTPAAAAALNIPPPPAAGTTCTTPAPPASAPTTTVPAKGNAVATIEAPAGVPFPNLNGSSPHYTKFTAAPPFCIDPTKDYRATVKTDVGTISIQLLTANAPNTVNNFVFLAGYHYFDGTVFHRVIPGFVDQGGDPTGTGQGDPGYKFGDELPMNVAAYDDGAVAMANSGPNTNGSQFYMVVGAGGKMLPSATFSMFGQVVSGINFMDKINADGGAPPNGTPRVLHRIISVSITESTPPPPPPSTTAPAAPAPPAPTTAPPAPPAK